MTLFVKGDRYVYLAHPPKTSGTSLTVMLRQAGWETRWHVDHSKAIHPAHWTADRYQDELERAGIDPKMYLLVRHPIARLESMFRRWERSATFEDWALRVLREGHIYASRRQVEYRPGRGASFKLLRYESGVTTNLSHIDPAADVAPIRLEAGEVTAPERTSLTPQTHRALSRYFKEDFYAFGYQP